MHYLQRFARVAVRVLTLAGGSGLEFARVLRDGLTRFFSTPSLVPDGKGACH
jgi:hypothetical protein